jgi:peptidoglycan/xylan/chitin deacetylase (PgdA/CDA1 family)
MTEAEQECWQWPEEVWRGKVERVRAGRSLKPAKWKNGARCAVALSFDADHETNELRDGGTSVGRLSWGQYGTRVGVPRILRMLKREDIKATFFVPAVAALLHPEEQKQVIAEGHEIGLHGWIHEINTKVPPENERELHFRAADTLEKITGVRPVGMRTPSWDFSEATLSIQRELGLLYDSSLFADDDPYEIVEKGKATGMVELPVEWIRDDAVYFNMNRFQALRPYTGPETVFDIFRREFDGAYEDGGLFLLTMHPHVITYRSRFWIIEELVRHAKAKGDVWFASHAEIARYVKDEAGL